MTNRFAHASFTHSNIPLSMSSPGIRLDSTRRHRGDSQTSLAFRASRAYGTDLSHALCLRDGAGHILVPCDAYSSLSVRYAVWVPHESGVPDVWTRLGVLRFPSPGAWLPSHIRRVRTKVVDRMRGSVTEVEMSVDDVLLCTTEWPPTRVSVPCMRIPVSLVASDSLPCAVSEVPFSSDAAWVCPLFHVSPSDRGRVAPDACFGYDLLPPLLDCAPDMVPMSHLYDTTDGEGWERMFRFVFQVCSYSEPYRLGLIKARVWLDGLSGVSFRERGVGTVSDCVVWWLVWQCTLSGLPVARHVGEEYVHPYQRFITDAEASSMIRSLSRAMGDLAWFRAAHSPDVDWGVAAARVSYVAVRGAEGHDAYALGGLPVVFTELCRQRGLSVAVWRDASCGVVDVFSVLSAAGYMCHPNKLLLVCDDLLSLLGLECMRGHPRCYVPVGAGRAVIAGAFFMSQFVYHELQRVYAYQLQQRRDRVSVADIARVVGGNAHRFRGWFAKTLRQALAGVGGSRESGRRGESFYATVDEFISSGDAPPCLVSAVKRAHGDANSARFKVWLALLSAGVSSDGVKLWWRSIYTQHTSGGAVRDSTYRAHDKTIDTASEKGSCVGCVSMRHSNLCPISDIEDVPFNVVCRRSAVGATTSAEAVGSPAHFARIRRSGRAKRGRVDVGV